MSRQESAHPLDTDLLDYIAGLCDPATRHAIGLHLPDCLPCRIKGQRLSELPPMNVVHVEPLAIPRFGRIESEQVSGFEARPGELWLTAADEATMVLVKTVRGDDAVVVVVPVALDVEAADGGALVLSDAASPLKLSIAIYEDLVLTLPTAALRDRVVPARRDIDLLALTESDPGVSRGSELEGPADQRLEVRQDLVDGLVALDSYGSDDGKTDASNQASRLAALRAALYFHRGRDCVVEQLASMPILPGKSDWTGLAVVKDFTTRVIVIETPLGLAGFSDFASAQALMIRLEGSALAVCRSRTDEAELYDAPTLFRAFELPEGIRASGPLISGLSLPDAVVKYLDQKRILPSALERPSHRAPRVDVRKVLAIEVANAVRATIERAGRLSPEKKSGYLRLQGRADELGRVLTRALEPDFDPESVVELIEDERP